VTIALAILAGTVPITVVVTCLSINNIRILEQREKDSRCCHFSQGEHKEQAEFIRQLNPEQLLEMNKITTKCKRMVRWNF
jgi:hypothetical protein